MPLSSVLPNPDDLQKVKAGSPYELKLTLCYSTPELLANHELPLNVAEAEDTNLLSEETMYSGNMYLYLQQRLLQRRWYMKSNYLWFYGNISLREIL